MQEVDIELIRDIPAQNFGYKDFCFLFEFVWLKILLMNQKLRTKFKAFIVKLHSMIILSMFYSF